MQLRLSVTDASSGVSTDLTVEARAEHTAADLVAALTDELGLADGVWSCRGSPLAPDTPLGRPPLLDGVGLTFGFPGARPSHPDRHQSSFVLEVTAGPDAGSRLRLGTGRHVVGRAPTCDLVVNDEGMSREHCTVEVSTEGVDLVDLRSTNGTFVRGIRISRGPLRPGDEVAAGDSRLVLRSAASRPAARSTPGDGTVLVRRSPRVQGRPFAAAFDLPRPPEPPAVPRVQWLAILLPLPICAVLAILWGPQLLAFALLGPVVSGSTTLAERRAGRRRYAVELARSAERTDEVERQITEAMARERALLLAAHPDPAEVQHIARQQTARLWERSGSDPLVIRLGIADLSSAVVVRGARSRGGLDPPALGSAPLTVDLAAVRVLGIAGCPAPRDAAARSVVAQLATLWSPSALRLWVAEGAEHDDRTGFGWTRWLPHRQRLDLGTHVVEQVTQVRRRASPRADPTRPMDVLLVPADAPAQVLAGLDRVTASGALVVVLAPDVARLPSGCGAVLTIGADGSGAAGGGNGRAGELSVAGTEPVAGAVIDGISVALAARLGRSMAPVREEGLEQRVVPDHVALREVLGASTASVAAVLEAWCDPPAGLRAVVGRTASDPLVLDLVADGPHALVGGTTGSGKSELLQTLVAGLAAAYPPEDLSVLLIDYKGGAAFRECAALPHVVGMVTDLDDRLAQRALTGLRAELRRRETLLANAGAGDLAGYRRSGYGASAPLPRLVIVVDEFRMLVEELPSFVEGVVRLAAVGRSLGLHLVLATQRPAGAITADIQANVNLRIALRMRDRADSEHVIDAADAALFPEDRPGRALMSTGAGRPVMFQAAWGGDIAQVPVEGPTVVRGLSRPGSRRAGTGSTDLALLVDTVQRAAAQRRSPSLPPPWLPPLPPELATAGMPESVEGVAIGLVDLPSDQRQPVLHWTPDGPPVTGVVGPPGSGRTTLVRTLVGQLAEASARLSVHVYAVDAGGQLGAIALLPNVGAVVAADDPVRLRRLVDRLRDEVRRRTVELAARSLTSLAEWRTGEPAAAPAHLLLIVDGWDVLADPGAGTLLGSDSLTLVDDLRAVLESGAAAGLSAVLTGGRSLMLGRTGRLCSSTICLGRPDAGDAAILGLPRAAQLPDLPGRGLRLEDGAEVQLAHLGADPAGTAQVRTLAELGRAQRRRMSGSGGAAPPFTVGALPESVRLDQLPTGRGLVCVDEDGVPRGLDRELDGSSWLVLGPRRSGRTTTLAALAAAYGNDGGGGAVWVRGRATLSVPVHPMVPVLGAADADRLTSMLAADPRLLVLVDDGDLLAGAPVEPVLVEAARAAGRHGGLVVCSAEPAALAAAFRGVAVEVARHRTGFLLCPTSVVDGDAFGVRVPRSATKVPGRGYLVSAGTATHIQVATDAGQPSAVA